MRRSVRESTLTERIIETVRMQKMSYFEKIVRELRHELLRLILKGKIEGQRGRGKERL